MTDEWAQWARRMVDELRAELRRLRRVLEGELDTITQRVEILEREDSAAWSVRRDAKGRIEMRATIPKIPRKVLAVAVGVVLAAGSRLAGVDLDIIRQLVEELLQ